jgi:hypothetical protein
VGVGQVEVADLVDGHPVVQGGGVDVDAFGDSGVRVSDQLRAEQSTGRRVAGDGDRDGPGAGIVGLVVVGDDTVARRSGAGLGRFGVAQAGAGGDEVEDLDGLGADGSGEAALAAQ